MRSESYFLPPLELTDEELAALQTCLYLLEGKFAYAEPLRLALQNLALGRPGFAEAPTETAMRVEVLDPEYSAEMQGRLGKLEGAISKQRTVKFPYWSISRDEERERTVNPYALFQDAGAWYVVGEDLDASEERTFRVSRVRGEIRFATRRERDFRLPADFDVDRYRGRPPWQIGEPVGEARIEVGGDTAWWVERTYGDSGRIEDGVFVTRVLEPAAPRDLGAPPGRSRGAAGPGRAPAGGRAGPAAGAGAPRGRAQASRRCDGRSRRGGGRPPGRAGPPGALRGAPGTARVPARPLRRGEPGRVPGAGARRALQHPARAARGAPLAAQPRQLRRRLLRRLRRARRATRSGSTRSSSGTRSGRRRG